jgi:hypothetical protein
VIQRLTFLIATLALAASASAQVVFTSPLPDGILQVRGDHADLRILVSLTGYVSFSYKLSSDIDTSSLLDGWNSITMKDGIVDTLLRVPKSLRDYGLYWRTGIYMGDTGGEIAGLTPGHIIGIGGQSNAVGWVWPPSPIFVAVPQGDIRMLINDSFWQRAEEPTDGEGQGPWIEMANELYAQIGDTLPIGIVNTAVGGTGLTISIASTGRWVKNSSNPDDTMYPHAIDRFRHAGSELDCFTWIQGEADGEGDMLFDPGTYRSQFAGLMQDFMSDLGDTFPPYHLQISGFSGPSNPETYPQAREALRVLPPSTLVGTAIGRPLWDSEFHYTVATYQAVGQMFAAAVLKQQYGITAPMYPPLMPDTIAKLDSITDGSIVGRYCVSLGWTRGGLPANLTIIRPDQYFALYKDGGEFDTALVWYRISPKDSSRVQIGLRNDSITLDHDWQVTYDPLAAGDRAPLVTIDPVSGDTIFGTAFYELPVQIQPTASAGVSDISVQSVVPNPTSNSINCYILAVKHESITIALYDDRGVVLRRSSAVLEPGTQDIPVSTDGLSSGNYWVALIDDNGQEIVVKAIVVN